MAPPSDPPSISNPASETERLRAIGDLLCKGILASRSLPPPAFAENEAETAGEDAEERIVAYLREHHAASPSEFQAVLKLSRSRVYRSLQRLLSAKSVVRNGERTTAAAYRLPADPSRN